MRRLLDHRLDVLFTHRLAFKPGGPLDQGDELLGLPLRLLPFQIASIHPGMEAEPETQGFGDGHDVRETRRGMAARQNALNRRTRNPAPLRELFVAKAEVTASFIQVLEQQVIVLASLPPPANAAGETLFYDIIV